jgi:hypothetical protein
MSKLFEECFVIPIGLDYQTALQQIDPQKLASKISSVEIEHQNQIFILCLEFCKRQDPGSYHKMINSRNNRKVNLPYGFSTMKGDIHITGDLTTVPSNLLLILNNYCNFIFKKD